MPLQRGELSGMVKCLPYKAGPGVGQIHALDPSFTGDYLIHNWPTLCLLERPPGPLDKFGPTPQAFVKGPIDLCLKCVKAAARL